MPRATLKIEVPLDKMGKMLQGRFAQEKSKRKEMEMEWLKDLRQQQGRYEDSVIFNDANASRAFVRLTRTKVRSVDARMAELIMPMIKEAWDIGPTPEPDIPPERKAWLQEQLKPLAEKKGVQISDSHVRKLEMEFARLAAKRMKAHIHDGFIETRFNDVTRLVTHSGHLYGTGILKGPLVQRKVVKAWERVEGGEFGITEKETMLPFSEHTRIWDYYPEATSPDLLSTDYDFQRHTYNRYQLRRMAQRPSFRSKPIHDHIAANPDGDASWEHYELDIFKAGRNNPSLASGSPTNKYEVLEYWGLVDMQDLEAEGVEMPE